MKIRLTSVFADDQSKAVDLYTEKFGFARKHDIPPGEARCLTEVGLRFTTAPTDVGSAVIALVDDSCGNLVRLFETRDA